MGQAKRRGSLEDRIKKAKTVVMDATKAAPEYGKKIIAENDELVELDVNIANVFKSQMGMTRYKRKAYPLKNTEANIQLSIEDHKRNGYAGTDSQTLLSAWGVITGQCLAAAHDKGKEFFMGQQFSMWISQSVAYLLAKIPGDIKTIRLHLHGTRNILGIGSDPWVCGWAPESKIELLDKAGKVMERVDYHTLRQGKSDAEVMENNAEQMSKMYARSEETA